MPEISYHSEFHRAAIEWAEAGFFVFPCKPLGKQPVGGHGSIDATQDIDQINDWWRITPDANLAVNVGLSGHVVIDVDPPHGPKTLQVLEQEHGAFPDTFTTKTPRGGFHYWFEGNERSLTDPLGFDIDTRGQGGYVLVPPSHVIETKTKLDKVTKEKVTYDVDGVYEYVDEAPESFATLPSWTSQLLTPKDVEASASQGLPVTRGKLEEILAHIDPDTNRDQWRNVVAGIRNTNIEDDDDETYRLQLCHDWSVGKLTGGEEPGSYTTPGAVDEVWDTMPPKEDGVGFGTLFHLAQTNGYEGPPPSVPTEEVFASVIEEYKDLPAKPSRFRLLNRRQWGDIPPPKWQIDTLMQEKTMNLCLGKEKSYKSFLALDMALAIATGTETFGSKTEQGCVAYGALEGMESIISSRIPAWCLSHGQEDDADDDLFVGRGPVVNNPGEVQEFGDQLTRSLQGRPCKLIIIDTVAKSMVGLDENSAADVGRYYAALDSLREQFECSLITIHHTGHSGERARGSSAFQAAFDAVWMVKADTSTKAVELWVNKQKDGAEPEEPFTFQGKSIGAGLAFFPTTLDEHHALTAAETLYSPKQVGLALKKLNAVGASGVTTAVLATALAPVTADHTQLERESAEAMTATALKKLAKTDLAAYCEKSGRTVLWALPGA